MGLLSRVADQDRNEDAQLRCDAARHSGVTGRKRYGADHLCSVTGRLRCAAVRLLGRTDGSAAKLVCNFLMMASYAPKMIGIAMDPSRNYRELARFPGKKTGSVRVMPRLFRDSVNSAAQSACAARRIFIIAAQVACTAQNRDEAAQGTTGVAAGQVGNAAGLHCQEPRMRSDFVPGTMRPLTQRA